MRPKFCKTYCASARASQRLYRGLLTRPCPHTLIVALLRLGAGGSSNLSTRLASLALKLAQHQLDPFRNYFRLCRWGRPGFCRTEIAQCFDQLSTEPERHRDSLDVVEVFHCSVDFH